MSPLEKWPETTITWRFCFLFEIFFPKSFAHSIVTVHHNIEWTEFKKKKWKKVTGPVYRLLVHISSSGYRLQVTSTGYISKVQVIGYKSSIQAKSWVKSSTNQTKVSGSLSKKLPNIYIFSPFLPVTYPIHTKCVEML